MRQVLKLGIIPVAMSYRGSFSAATGRDWREYQRRWARAAIADAAVSSRTPKRAIPKTSKRAAAGRRMLGDTLPRSGLGARIAEDYGR